MLCRYAPSNNTPKRRNGLCSTFQGRFLIILSHESTIRFPQRGKVLEHFGPYFHQKQNRSCTQNIFKKLLFFHRHLVSMVEANNKVSISYCFNIFIVAGMKLLTLQQ